MARRDASAKSEELHSSAGHWLRGQGSRLERMYDVLPVQYTIILSVCQPGRLALGRRTEPTTASEYLRGR